MFLSYSVQLNILGINLLPKKSTQISLTLCSREYIWILLLLSQIKLGAISWNEKSHSQTKLKTYSWSTKIERYVGERMWSIVFLNGKSLKRKRRRKKKENKLSYYISKQNFFIPVKCDRIIQQIHKNNTTY